jgi:hypothetical protein
VDRYTGNEHYIAIQGLTRGRNTGPIDSGALRKDAQAIGVLDDLLSSDVAVSEDSFEVWRGMAGGMSTVFPDGVHEGTEFYDDGFVSASFDKQIASRFTGDEWKRAGALFKIRTKPGQRLLVTEAVPSPRRKEGAQQEQEALFPRGTRFRVVGQRGTASAPIGLADRVEVPVYELEVVETPTDRPLPANVAGFLGRGGDGGG